MKTELDVVKRLNERYYTLNEDKEDCYDDVFVLITDGNFSIIKFNDIELYSSEDSEYALTREKYFKKNNIQVLKFKEIEKEKENKLWFKEKNISEGFVYEDSDEYEDICQTEDFIFEATLEALKIIFLKIKNFIEFKD